MAFLTRTAKGWPYPSTFVIDPQGVVRWRFVEKSQDKRPSNQQIVAELRKIKSL